MTCELLGGCSQTSHLTFTFYQVVLSVHYHRFKTGISYPSTNNRSCLVVLSFAKLIFLNDRKRDGSVYIHFKIITFANSIYFGALLHYKHEKCIFKKKRYTQIIVVVPARLGSALVIIMIWICWHEHPKKYIIPS